MKEKRLKDFVLLCSYIVGAMLITAGSISHFNSIIIAVGAVIFGLSIVGIYDLFPTRKKRK